MTHQDFLSIALEEAVKGLGFCAPNPAVGVVVVKDNAIIAKGYHQGFGQPHAEANALQGLSDDAIRGSTLYVTLEPCCHWGKTPPCTDIITQKHMAQVYYGYHDPNPLIQGKTKQILAKSNIHCDYIQQDEIDEFYAAYAYWQKHKKPLLTAKIALSLDGKIAGENHSPVAITGKKAMAYTHRQRKSHDGILTTVKTIIQDDPKLNVRLDATSPMAKKLFILDTKLQLPLNSNIITTAETICLFYGKDKNTATKVNQFEQKQIQCIPIALDKGLLNLHEILVYIGEQGLHRLWVEAGGTLLQALIKAELLKKLLIYIAPKTLGANALSAFNDKIDLTKTNNILWQQLGQDGLCEIRW